ncbi:hypothetical protein K438DRAFT_1761661 [Mycena galopus ATCC 62051]|nr:hypothetical protein K438DRAFT_1761661 [Mycena galopus ATCC 62051]
MSASYIANYRMNPATISRSKAQASLQVDAVDVQRHVNEVVKRVLLNLAINVAAAATLLESPRTDDLQYIMNERDGKMWLYQSIVEDGIVVRYKVLREVPGKDKGALRNLIEGNANIRADANPSFLRESGIPTMEPKIIQALRGFQLKWEKIVFREIFNSLGNHQMFPTSMRVVLSTGKAKAKDGAPGFRKPARPVDLAFVIDSEQWEVIECYLVQRDRIIRNPHRDSDSKFSSSDDEFQLPSPSDYQLNFASFGGGETQISSAIKGKPVGEL